MKLIYVQWFKYYEYHDLIKDTGVGTESVRSSKGEVHPRAGCEGSEGE